jgi:hypothetical protein
VLDKLRALPVSTWTYRNEDLRIRHMGPTAQDFHAAFGLGHSDRSIGTVDADGVALVASKALLGRTDALQGQVGSVVEENATLRAQLAALQQVNADLEVRLERLERRLETR